MLLGVVSDTHARYDTVTRALALLRQQGVELIVHCGDIDDTATVRLFAGLPTHFVFGNCDFDRGNLALAMEEIGATLHEPFGEIELAGRKIGFVHSDNKRLFQDLQQRGDLDYLFYGHTHQATEHRSGTTRVINPGALQRARTKTCLVLDPQSGELRSLVVE